MPKFPEPPEPAELAGVGSERRLLPPGTELWRLYFRGGRHPTLWDAWRHYGPLHGRFDHLETPPSLQARGILYAAERGTTCLAEVFQDTRVIDRRARQPWLAAFRLRREVGLLDLTSAWPTRAGASMALASGARPRARRWSRAIYDAYPEIEGLHYPSSMDANRPVVALYERAADAVAGSPTFHRPLDDPALLWALSAAARELGYGLI